MIECYDCGFYDSDYGECTCSELDSWYACPIESELPENKKLIEKYAAWSFDHKL